MNSRLIIAAGDISSSQVLARRFRGKIAKEIYRCGKGIVLTSSIVKPVAFALATIPEEFHKGIIYTAVGQIGEYALGYLSVIDLMYGKYNESYFEPPVILIFTNNTLFNAESPQNDFSHYLSEDRWIHLLIMKDELHIKQQKHYPYVTKVNKKVNDRAVTNNSIQFIR